MDQTDAPVMPIVITTSTTSTHIDLIEKVADAVLDAVRQMADQASTDPQISHLIQQWIDNGIRKTVRKAKHTAFMRACAEDDAQIIRPTVYIGHLKAYPQFSSFERRAQVSGWGLSPRPEHNHCTPDDLGAYDWGSRTAPDDIVIAVDAGLSTGKAAAAAGHIATCIAIDVLLSHRAHGKRIRCVLVDCIDEQMQQDALYVIRDNGHTEVEPGHVTAALITA